MKKRILFLIFLLSCVFIFPGCGRRDSFNDAEMKIPYYFIAVYNNSHHGDRDGKLKIKEEYAQLKKMVARADEYGIKLTLMFPPQWAGEIAADDLSAWKRSGHEIGAYHQDVFSDNWDGYTNFSDELALNERSQRKASPEAVLGDLEGFMNELEKIDPKISSGCLGEETSKAALPEGIIYGTCSGFANFGEPGRMVRDSETPMKGINEYISVGNYGGEKRKWAAHYSIADLKNEKSAEETFYKMVKGVYGSVNSSALVEEESFFTWLDFLHQRDLQGEMSRTLSEIIDDSGLPEKNLP